MFSLVNISRFLKINPEDALRKTSEKFITRFKNMEREFTLKGEEISEATLEEFSAKLVLLPANRSRLSRLSVGDALL